MPFLSSLFNFFASLLLFFCVIVPRAILHTIISSAIYFSSRYHGLVEPRSVAYIYEYDKSPLAIIVCTLNLKGRHPATQDVYKKLQHLVSKYPLLTAYPAYFFSFPCWKREENFQIEEHVFLHECQTEGDLNSVRTYLLKRPFPSLKSPWEVHLLNLAGEDDSSYIFFRVHHSLADGYSLLNLLQEIGSFGSEGMFSGKSKKRVGRFKNLAAFLSVVCNLYPMISWKAENLGYDCRPDKIHTVDGTALPLKIIKEGKSNLGIGFQAFLLMALETTMAEWRESKGMRVGAWPCFLPIPIPHRRTGHQSFQNRLSFLSVPMKSKEGLEMCPKKRAKEIKAYLGGAGWTGLKHGHLFQLVGFLPPSLLRKSRDTSLPLTLTDFPVPHADVRIFGRQCMGFRFHLNFNNGNSGAVFTGLSYEDEWMPSLTVSETWCGSKYEAQELVESFAENVRELHEAAKCLDNVV